MPSPGRSTRGSAKVITVRVGGYFSRFRASKYLDLRVCFSEQRRRARVRVLAARGGRGVVVARAVRLPELRVLLVRDEPADPPPVARRLHGHDLHVDLLQDLPRLVLQPSRSAAPDLARPPLRLPGTPGRDSPAVFCVYR